VRDAATIFQIVRSPYGALGRQPQQMRWLDDPAAFIMVDEEISVDDFFGAVGETDPCHVTPEVNDVAGVVR
jgi:hypothetical protein